MCFGVPLPPYIKEEREEAGHRGHAMGGNRLGLLVQVAPFLLSEGERGKEREREKERGAAPPPLVQFGLPMGGAPPHVGFPLSPLWPMLALTFPGGFR